MPLVDKGCPRPGNPERSIKHQPFSINCRPLYFSKWVSGEDIDLHGFPTGIFNGQKVACYRKRPILTSKMADNKPFG